MALTKDQIKELILEAPDLLDMPGISFDEDARQAWGKIVNPHRFVMIPDYILKSWIPILGTSKTLVTLAFRQVAYISKCKELIGDEVAEASIEQLSRWSGLSVGGVHKILSDPGYLTWFVKGIGAKTDEAGNIYADRDRRSYHVRIDIPLTPEDQVKIRTYLEEHLPKEDDDWPLVLYDAHKARKRTVPKKAALPDSPRTIQEIVKVLRGADRPLTRRIDEACIELYEQWVHPGYFGRATHYFLQRWVPELSSSVACLILWARRRAYIDSQLEEVRFLRLGSNQELAKAIGVSDRTIRRIKNDPINSLFLSFADEEHLSGILDDLADGFIEVDRVRYRLSPSVELDDGLELGDSVRLVLERYSDGSSLVFGVYSAQERSKQAQIKQGVRLRVRMSDPIHPDEWKRYETLLGLEDHPGLWSKVNVDWTRMNDRWSKVNDALDNSESNQKVNEIRPEVKASRTEVYDPLTEANTSMTGLKESRSEVNTLLKESLTESLKESTNKGIKQLQQEEVVVVLNKGWNIESILKNGAVRKQERERILDEWLTRGLEFIAHLLFGLSQESITSPVLFATRRFLEKEEPASDFLELAQLDPVNLAIDLRRSRYGSGWGERQAVAHLSQNDGYDSLVRLEAFNFEQDYWDEDSFTDEELDADKDEQYIQMSLVENESADQMTAGELWNTVKEQLRQEIPAANYDKWVKDAVGVDFEDNVLTVGARSESAKNWLEDRLDSTARRVITGIISRTVDVQFVIQ
jgi:hypothetical protein